MQTRLMTTLTVLLLIGSTIVVRADEQSPKTWPPRLLLNSDCGTPVFYKFDAPMSEDQLCHVLYDLPGTRVDAFLPCPQFSDDQFWFPTRVAEPYDGRHVKDGKFEDQYFKRVANNVRSLNERGLDPMQVWEKQSHKHGMWFIPTLRMNDIHKDYVDRWPSLRSHWELKRTHLLIGDKIPPWYTAPYKYTWAMDYAHQEVRQRKLDIISEICTRYDVDGFEMDFLRHVYYFRHAEEAAGMKKMNAFIGSVRRRLDEIGEKKGKRIRLLARVPPQLRECRQIGLDVPTWIKNNWVDMVIPMASGYLDMDADVASFVRLAKGTDCAVAGGLEYYVRGYRKPNQKGTTWASIEMLRASAASIWAQGASSVYLFNYDCHGPFPFRGDKRQALQEIDDPKKLIGKTKRYLVTVDMNQRSPQEGGTKQLPLALTEKQNEKILHFSIADDLAVARKNNSLESVELNVMASNAGLLQVKLNGHSIKPTEQSVSKLVFKSPPVVQGKNQVEVRLREGAGMKASRIVGLDVWVRYR